MSEHIPARWPGRFATAPAIFASTVIFRSFYRKLLFTSTTFPRAQARDLPMQIISHSHVLRAH